MGRDELENILQRKEYQVYYEDHRSIWKIIYDWAVEMLQKLLEKLFPAFQSTPNLAGFIVSLVVILFVIFLLVLLFKLWQKRRSKRKYEESVPLSNIHELNWTYKDHFNQAGLAEEARDYKQSIRHLFLALLLYYDEIEWLKAEVWKTNWEYYLELKKRANKEAGSFNQLAKTFDAVTYGRKKIEQTEFIRFKQELEEAYRLAKNKSARKGSDD